MTSESTHKMQVGFAFGDDFALGANKVVIVCKSCGRTLSFEKDDNGNLQPMSRIVLSAGNEYVGHSFSMSGTTLSVSVEVEDDKQ